MASTSIRRSGRQRKANTKYVNDIFDKETLRLLRESSESSRPSSPDTSDSEISKTDDDFNAAQATAEAGKLSDGDDDLSLDSGSAAGISDGSGIQTPDESDDNMSIATSGDSVAEDYEGQRKKTGRVNDNMRSATSHSEGLAKLVRRFVPYEANALTFGTTADDILPVLHSRDQWFRARDATFPSRKSLDALAKEGEFDTKVTFGINSALLHSEATTGWEWYHQTEKGGKFRQRQLTATVSDAQLRSRYAPLTENYEHLVAMGPWQKQHTFPVGSSQAYNFGKTWERENKDLLSDPGGDLATSTMKIVEPCPEVTVGTVFSTVQPSARGKRKESNSPYHEGWIFAVGQKIQCLAWASPMERPCQDQYLAIACSSKSSQRTKYANSVGDGAPAFHPSIPCPSSIQIWAVRASDGEDEDNKYCRLDMNTPARLVKTLCTDWGEIRQMSFCPCIKKSNHGGQTSEETSLGLLGLVTGDGCVRVLDVSGALSPSSSPADVLVKSAAFTASPPAATIFSSLAFVSPTDLTVGDSMGAVHLFNILNPHNANPSKSYIQHNLQNTYIQALSPAYPSPLPTFMASVSATGMINLADLRHPEQENVSFYKPRLPTKNLIFSPLICAWITSVDGVGHTKGLNTTQSTLVCHSLRRFGSQNTFAKLSSGGSATCLAASRWHPCILAGTAGGTVFGTNYLRKCLPGGKNAKRGGCGGWIQKLCEYDWTPEAGKYSADDPVIAGTADEVERPGDPQKTSEHQSRAAPIADLHPGEPEDSRSVGSDSLARDSMFYPPDTRTGRSRFQEGFKPERAETALSAHRRKPGAELEDVAQVIFEEEQAATAMDWNPNLRCAGWAAIGWGSGVVRIQDLAHGDD